MSDISNVPWRQDVTGLWVPDQSLKDKFLQWREQRKQEALSKRQQRQEQLKLQQEQKAADTWREEQQQFQQRATQAQADQQLVQAQREVERARSVVQSIEARIQSGFLDDMDLREMQGSLNQWKNYLQERIFYVHKLEYQMGIKKPSMMPTVRSKTLPKTPVVPTPLPGTPKPIQQENI